MEPEASVPCYRGPHPQAVESVSTASRQIYVAFNEIGHKPISSNLYGLHPPTRVLTSQALSFLQFYMAYILQHVPWPPKRSPSFSFIWPTSSNTCLDLPSAPLPSVLYGLHPPTRVLTSQALSFLQFYTAYILQHVSWPPKRSPSFSFIRPTSSNTCLDLPSALLPSVLYGLHPPTRALTS
jgi:hypothetical protein